MPYLVHGRTSSTTQHSASGDGKREVLCYDRRWGIYRSEYWTRHGQNYNVMVTPLVLRRYEWSGTAVVVRSILPPKPIHATTILFGDNASELLRDGYMHRDDALQSQRYHHNNELHQIRGRRRRQSQRTNLAGLGQAADTSTEQKYFRFSLNSTLMHSIGFRSSVAPNAMGS